MLVTKDITEQIPIPHEDGQWMQFRRLSWLEMTDAAETAERRSVKKMTQFGSEAVGAIIASYEKTAAATADTDGDGAATPTTAKAPTVASYDRESLLENGITAWSYEEKPSPKTIKQLDAETARWAAEQIFELSRERTKEERGNA